MLTRGLVVLPDHEIKGNNLAIQGLGAVYDIPRIRRNLLYWDKLDFPDNPIICGHLPREAQFLIDDGVLIKSPSPGMMYGDAAEIWARSNLEVWRQHDQQEPGQWSIGQASPRWSLPVQNAGIQMVMVELYNVLPQPDESVSLEDVYKFKQDRKDELQALRSHLDKFYEGILDANDIPHARTAAITDLEKSLNDLNKAANEKWTQRLMSSVSVQLNAPGVVAGALALASTPFTGGAIEIGLHMLSSLGIPLASGVKISISKDTFLSKIPAHLKDFAYLYKPSIPVKP